jgi:protein-S-isoprenylcysteine O-methyltransferase Ste14
MMLAHRSRAVAMLLRHLLAIAVLPVMVAVVVPVWIWRSDSIRLRIGASGWQLPTQAAGVLLLLVGLALFISSLRRFATEGQGTLAPWDPPKRLVVRGPYRYVRNPMISGVVFVLFAEALIILSRSHFIWALTFLGLNLVYIPLLEEPMLRQRFGDAYIEYCRHVPRLLPRGRPWHPEPPATGDAI